MGADVVLIGGATWHGNLERAAHPRGVVIVTDAPGSFIEGERGDTLRRVLMGYGMSTLRIALAHPAAELATATDARRSGWVIGFDEAIDWIGAHEGADAGAIGLLGAQVSAAAALHVAAAHADRVTAVVGCSAHIEQTLDVLPRVHAATLLLVAALDAQALQAHRAALTRLRGVRRLESIPGAGSGQFSEPGVFDTVAHLAGSWLRDHLDAPRMQ